MKRLLGHLLYEYLVIGAVMTGFMFMLHGYLSYHFRIIPKVHHAPSAFPYHPR